MSPADVLGAIHTRSRMITGTDLGVLFTVTPKIRGDRTRRGELQKPLPTWRYTWSPQQFARFPEGPNAVSPT